jgi:NhaA family Na+:H+ antiporter
MRVSSRSASLPSPSGCAAFPSTSRGVFGAGLLGGIGFTMSIFITNLAFGGQAQAVVASKMAILVASLTSGVLGYAWLKLGGAPTAADTDPATVDYAGSDAPRD